MTDSSSPTTVSQPRMGPKVSRRTFLSGLAAVVVTTSAGAFLAPARSCAMAAGNGSQPDAGWLDLCPLATLTNGVPKGFPFARRVRAGGAEAHQTGIAYAITHDGRQVQVLANICTHGGCRVLWQPERQVFTCPCHGGQYDSGGRVLSGLPPRPLEQFPCRINAGMVQIRLEV